MIGKKQSDISSVQLYLTNEYRLYFVTSLTADFTSLFLWEFYVLYLP
jgi:hypothetical protein